MIKNNLIFNLTIMYKFTDENKLALEQYCQNLPFKYAYPIIQLMGQLEKVEEKKDTKATKVKNK